MFCLFLYVLFLWHTYSVFFFFWLKTKFAGGKMLLWWFIFLTGSFISGTRGVQWLSAWGSQEPWRKEASSLLSSSKCSSPHCFCPTSWSWASGRYTLKHKHTSHICSLCCFQERLGNSHIWVWHSLLRHVTHSKQKHKMEAKLQI